MKTNLLYFALALALLFAACKKDEASSDIEGNWEVTSINNSNCDDASSNGDLPVVDGCVDLFVFSICIELEFKSNDTFEYRYTTTIIGSTEVDTETGTYTIDGNEISATGEDGTSFEFTYNSDGPTLTGNYRDEEEGCDIRHTYKKK